MPECVGGQHEMVSLEDGNQGKVTHICTKCYVGYNEFRNIHFASSGAVHPAPPSFKEFGPGGSGPVSPETMAFFQRLWIRAVQSSLDHGARFPEEHKKMNGLAQAARVFGFLSLIAIPFTIPALICGYKALGQIEERNENGTEEARTGIWLGWGILGVWSLAMLVIGCNGGF